MLYNYLQCTMFKPTRKYILKTLSAKGDSSLQENLMQWRPVLTSKDMSDLSYSFQSRACLKYEMAKQHLKMLDTVNPYNY